MALRLPISSEEIDRQANALFEYASDPGDLHNNAKTYIDGMSDTERRRAFRVELLIFYLIVIGLFLLFDLNYNITVDKTIDGWYWSPLMSDVAEPCRIRIEGKMKRTAVILKHDTIILKGNIMVEGASRTENVYVDDLILALEQNSDGNWVFMRKASITEIISGIEITSVTSTDAGLDGFEIAFKGGFRFSTEKPDLKSNG